MTINRKVKIYSTWRLLFVAGMLLIGIGISGFIEPWQTFINLIKYTGWALIFSSSFIIIHAISIKSITGEAKWLIMEGVLDLLFGLVLVFNPFLTAIAFPLLIGFWILLRGLLKTVLSLVLYRTLPGAMFILIIGIISVVFGIIIISFPFNRSNGIGLAMTVFSFLMGALYLYDAFRFRKKEDTLIAVV